MHSVRGLFLTYTSTYVVIIIQTTSSNLVLKIFYFSMFVKVPIAIGGPGLTPGVRFRNDVPTGGLANVAATVMNLHGFEAPSDYETTLIEVV